MFVTASPAPVKAALELLGHEVGSLRLPLVECDEAERAHVRDALAQHGLLTGVTAA
jgi:4-hydroxy-tetrahydrodipicolinate synthase